ncbi:MAG: transcriptional coactivator p15/PC4 family protein [Nanoarchaeota archaeon]|nr:transcriptional coactivator p15/PC4 family protein [Nanoarchaeota archaeon]
MEKDIGKIQKGEYQGTVTEIVIGLREYNGKTGVDIREFTKSETYTGPTKKGLRIPADKFEEFKQMINSIKPSDLTPQLTPSTQHLTSNTEPTETENDDAGIDESGLM